MGVTQIVVTGVNGFIGNRVLERMMKLLPEELQFPRSHRFELVGSDLLATQTRFTARRFAGSSRYRFFSHTDLLDALRSGALSPDIVIHNGACSSTTERDPEIFRDLNLGYSRQLWEICADKGVPFIYASSASVYGNGKCGFDDAPDALEKFEAMNLYAASKLDFDRFAMSAERSPPLWMGMRYFNVFGPFEAHKQGQASMVFHGFHQIMRTGEMRLFRSTDPHYGDGEQRRDFVWIDDVVGVTAELLRRFLIPDLARTLKQNLLAYTGRSGCFLNVGTGQSRTWNDLARAIFAALERPERISYFDMPDALREQYQNFTEACATSAGRIGLAFEWTALEDGVRAYVRKVLLREIG
jgi:ADP-L-glycero-D-manno-heptose 6-epimerase